MKAIMRDAYGPPEALELRDVDLPVVGDDGVLVRVRAASLNAADLDYLKRENVPDRVIIEMQNARAAPVTLSPRRSSVVYADPPPVVVYERPAPVYVYGPPRPRTMYVGGVVYR